MKQHLHCANSSASNFGSRFAAVYLLLIFSLCVVNLPAKDKQLQFKTIEVKHFTLAEGVAASGTALNTCNAWAVSPSSV